MKITKTFLHPAFLALAGAVVLGACTGYTGSAANPLERSLKWFSYVGGDDIRDACRAGGRDHFRFVYNAVYEEQIRAYELQGVADGAQYVARARNEGGDVSKFQLSNPLGPWELERSEARLTNEQAAKIVNALSRDAASAPPSAGRQVGSDEFYWIVAACNAGSFRIWAFEQGPVELSELAFVPELLAYDRTGIPLREFKGFEGFDQNAFYIKINANADGIVR